MDALKKWSYPVLVLLAFFGGVLVGFRLWGRNLPHNPERTGKDIADLRELGGTLDGISRDAGELGERLGGDKELVDELRSGADGLGAIPGDLDRAGGELGGIGEQLRGHGAELRGIYQSVLSRPVADGKVP
jgi:hypothetical protein